MVRRRNAFDPLSPVSECRWLVERDLCHQVVEYCELWPKTDLRAVLTDEAQNRLAAGWTECEIPKGCDFFFAKRGDVRVCVAIEAYEPGTAPMR